MGHGLSAMGPLYFLTAVTVRCEGKSRASASCWQAGKAVTKRMVSVFFLPWPEVQIRDSRPIAYGPLPMACNFSVPTFVHVQYLHSGV